MQAKRAATAVQRRETRAAWIMLAPNTLGLVLFVFIPIIYAFYLSLFSWNGLTDMKYIALKNFLKLFQDDDYGASLLTTLRYAVTYVPCLTLLSLGIALVVNSLRQAPQEVVRTSVFLPYCISTVISGLVWSFLLDPKLGYVNTVLRYFGLPAQAFLGSPNQALNCIVVTSLWIQTGYYSIIFLAALKDIPRDYYEASNIDGANSWQKFHAITLPHLRNAGSFVLVVSTIGAFQVFDQIKILTSGGPNSATSVAVLKVWETAFTLNKLGYASAQAFILFLILMVFSSIQLKLISSEES